MTNQLNARFIRQELIPANPVYRTDERYRYYYTIYNEQIKIYPSVTSILNAVMPTSEYLIKWYAEFGYQKAKQMMQELSLYGTFMHHCFAELLIHKSFDLANLPTMIRTFAIANNITFDIEHWENKIKDDMIALRKFINDFDIEPIAIEIPLVSHKHQIGGAIDLVVRMKIGSGINGNVLKADLKYNNGEIVEDRRQTITAIIDWKSGRHGFYPINEAQGHMYKLLWEDNFPEIPIDKVYNWAPKDWIDEPTYTLKDQTNSIEQHKIKHYYALFMIEEEDKKARKHHTIEGIINLKNPINETLKIYVEDLESKLTRLFSNKENKQIVTEKQKTNGATNKTNGYKISGSGDLLSNINQLLS
jgi:hypothetical protein